MKIKGLFVSAIGTDSGKTVVSSILCSALNAQYWKPIQSGLPRDTETVAQLAGLKPEFITPEKYLLNTPVSPHQSADLDGISILAEDFSLPQTSNFLVVEGAGGLMVPINHKPEFVADLITQLQLPLILVSNLYLGSINHTLLSLHYLKNHKIPLLGIIFNGPNNDWSKKTIEAYANAPTIAHIPNTENISTEWVREVAISIKPNLLAAMNQFETSNV